MGGDLTVHESSATITVASWRQVVITRYRGRSTVKDINAIRRVSVALARAHPAGIAHLNDIVLEDGAGASIDDDVRAALLRLLSDADVRLRAASIVFPGSGFAAAFVRSLLGGLVLLARSRATVRFHGTMQEGTTWLGETMAMANAGPLPSSELLRAVKSLT